MFSVGPLGSPAVHQLEEMLREDSWIKSIEGAITWPIRSAGYDIEEAEGDKGEADTCRRMFFDPEHAGGMKTPVETVVAQMTGAFARRASFHEIVWDFRDGLHVVDKLAFREAATCAVETDDFGNLDGFKQTAYSRRRGTINERFRKDKALVYVHDGSASPLVGSSVFETAYRNYKDKRKLLFLYYKALEKFGAPPTVGKTESDAAEDQEAMFRKAEAIRSNGTVGLGPGEEILLPQVSGVGEQFKDALRYLDFQMAVSSYVQFLALAQEGNSGAYALSRDHSDFLVIVTTGRMHEIASAITTQVLGAFVRFNFGAGAAFPAFKFRSLVEEEKAKALETWRDLITKSGAPVAEDVFGAIQEKALQALDVNPERAEAASPEGGGEAPSRLTTAPAVVDPMVQQATEALRQQVSS